MLDVYERETSITSLLFVMSQVAALPTQAPAETIRLEAAVTAVQQNIANSIASRTHIRNVALLYPSEEDLLAYGDSASDFLILELAEHFRRYDLSQFPAFAGVEYRRSVRGSTLVYKRASGHVTGSFAEAMCPWVLEELGIKTGSLLRFKSLSPGAFGKVVPDFLILTPAGEVPCEVKHYSDWINWSGMSTAVTQVASAVRELGSSHGYIFAALNKPNGQFRYTVEVIRLAA